MSSTLLVLLLAVSSAASVQASSSHPLRSSLSAVSSLTPSLAHTSTGNHTGLATSLLASSSRPLSLSQTTSTTTSSYPFYSPSPIPPYYVSSSSSSATHTSLSSDTNTGTVYSSSSRVSIKSSSISSSTSISTTISSRSFSGQATTLTIPSPSPSPSSLSSSSSSSSSSSLASSSGANTWSFSTTQSTTLFPVYQTPTVTATGGPAETSQAAQFFITFSALYQDRQLISDPKHKTNYINYVKNTESQVQSFIKGLSVQPPKDVGCSGTAAKKRSSKSKRGLLSAIAGLAGDVGNLLACANQVLSNMESVIDDVDPSISEIETLTDVINEIGGYLQNTNENKPTASQPTNSHSTTSMSSSSSSSSSCTPETALHVTVLCMPTTITTAGSTVSTTTCSPSTTITTKGCSVTGWTSTISSSTSTSSQIPCASDTCGNLCPMRGGPLSGASVAVIATTENCASISTITTSALPTASYGAVGSAEVASPTPASNAASPIKKSISNDPGASVNATLIYDSLIKRVLPEVSSPDPAYVASLETTWIDQDGLAAAQWFDYPLIGHIATGVNGIYGCTSVIIPSEKGVYISHIWEVPVFINNQYEDSSDSYFTENSFTALNSGSATSVSIQSLIGTEENPGPLNVIYAPKVFVVTPFTTDFDRDILGITTRLRYQDRAEQLAESITKAISGSGSGFTLGYTRTGMQESTRPEGTAGRAIVEVDPFQYWLTSDHASPTTPGLQVGQWRLWIEDELVSVQDFWVPAVTYPAGGIQKRDTVGYANPCSSYTNTSTTFISKTSSTSTSTRSASSSVSSSSSFKFSISSTSKSTTTSPPPSTLLTSRSTATTHMPTITSSTPRSRTTLRISTTRSYTTPSSLITAPPICSEGNNQLMGMDNTPSSWCFCGFRGPFSTISGATTSYCAFSVLPTQTISLTSHSTSITTACVLTSTMYTPNPPATPTQDMYCQCGNIIAGIGTTTIGSNVVLGCGMTPTPMIVSTISTIAPTTTTTMATSKLPYQTGVCNVHILEASRNYNEPLIIQLNISDGGGSLLTSQNNQINWGDSVSVKASDSKLPYDIDVDFTDRTAQGVNKRLVIPPPPVTIDWEDWILNLTAGSTSWSDTDTDSNTLPYCSVGGWDNEDNFWQVMGFEASGLPNRQMDCHWTC